MALIIASLGSIEDPNVEFDFFVKDTDRKPQSLHNKVYTATILIELVRQVCLLKR